MRIPSRSVIAASLGLAALLIGYSVLQSREPTYKGRTMQQWLFEGENSEAAREALLNLGTNNLPLLVRRLSYDPAKTFFRFIPPQLAQRRILDPLMRRELRKDAFANDAAMVFQILGPRAAPAVPELVKTAKTGGNTPAVRALNALESVGEAGVPAIISVTSCTNQHQYLRAQAVLRLSSHTNSQEVRFALTNALHDPDPSVRIAATNTLNGTSLE